MTIKKEYNEDDILTMKLDANIDGNDSGHLELELETNQGMDLSINGKPFIEEINNIKLKLNGSIEAEDFLKYISDFKKSLE